MDKIIVSVYCTAYNHERYIRQALDSFVMQQTNFKYEVVIADDASTDRTADIIREYEIMYPEIIKPIYYKENQFSRGIPKVNTMMEHSRGKYIAVCEGDDFWTDIHKLQIQVDYMEAHPECSLCIHSAYNVKDDGVIDEHNVFNKVGETRKVTTEEVIRNWIAASSSQLYRKDVIEYPIPFKQDCVNMDYCRMAYLALKGEVYYIDKLMSAYRTQSVGSINWVYHKNVVKQRESFIKFAKMLERLDEYSEYKYSESIKGKKDEVMFQYWASFPNVKKMKTYPDLYSSMTVYKKVKLYVRTFFPWAYELRQMKKHKREERKIGLINQTR